jgi:hypothetical protein
MDNWQGTLIQVFDPSAPEGTAIWTHEDTEKGKYPSSSLRTWRDDRIWARVGMRERKHSAVQSAIVCINCVSVGIPSL